LLPESKKIADYEVEPEFPKLWAAMLRNGGRVEHRDGKELLLLLGIEDVAERTNGKRRFALTLKRSADSLAACWDARCA